MRKIAVKICGITSVEDGLSAINAGADMIGIIFAPQSKRLVSVGIAKEIISAVSGQVPVVGVFMGQSEDEVAKIQEEVGLNLLQFHHNDGAVIVAPGAGRMPAAPERHHSNGEFLPGGAGVWPASFLLFDRPKRSQLSAETFHRDLLAQLKRNPPEQPYLVAGGIDEGNAGTICSALLADRNFAGIDVASGVESSIGHKDEKKMHALIKRVREASHNAIHR